MNVLVRHALDSVHLADLSALLTRCAEYDHHSALAEPQEMAVARSDLGGEGAQVVLAYDDEADVGQLFGCAVITPALDGATALHVAVDPDHRAPSEGVQHALLEAALEHADGGTAGELRLWIMKADKTDDDMAAALGFTPERDLLQMRVPLPLPEKTVASARPVTTRPYEQGRDDEEWLKINNAAFADHPEQGGWTLHDLHERTEAEWFDPEGFLVADRPDGPGLLGSCWTKIHRHEDPVLGEIYVISVDPSHHSQGWGRALTVAGLQWMANQGVTVGMLYTTASNTAAVTLYEALGFTTDHSDRSYLKELRTSSPADPPAGRG
jgi:mycothiol synthase